MKQGRKEGKGEGKGDREGEDEDQDKDEDEDKDGYASGGGASRQRAQITREDRIKRIRQRRRCAVLP